MLWELVGLFVGSYLLGAVPIGVLVTRAKGIDISQVGSGNVGATNVSRALGRGWGLAVFVLDALKGFIPAFAAHYVSPHQEVWFLAGIAAVFGHCISPFLGFQGGKGISTALGMVAGSLPWVAAGGFGVWVVVFLISRYVSLSSLVATFVAVAICAALPGRSWYVVGAFGLLFVFVVFTHRANIKRLMQGMEPKFSFRDTRG